MPHTRHPDPGMPGRAGRLARALGALLVLIAVVAGVPALMSALHLVPHAIPAWDQIRDTLTQRDTGQLLVVVLAAVIWLCWALFTLSLIGEIAAAARHRPTRLLPGLAVFQRPAAALVAAVMIGLAVTPMIGGAAVALASPPPAATHAAPAAARTLPAHRAPSAPPDQSPAPAATGPTYRVQPRDTLWGIAERTLGDPLRYPEILSLNTGRIGPDNEIDPGTVLVLPADAAAGPRAAAPASGPARVTVQPGDTLSGITEQATRTAQLYPEVADANNITDPDRIFPGQVITIPADLLPADPPARDTATQGTTVTVQPGDTLSGITEQATGDGSDWPAVWRANQGRTEPGGAHFDDPDLIYPGWSITIPAPAAAAQPHTPSPTDGHNDPATTPASAPGQSTAQPDSAGPTDSAPSPTRQAPSAAGTDTPSDTGPAAAPSAPAGIGGMSPVETAEPPAAPASASASASAAADAATGQAWPAVTAFAGGGALLAGLSLTALLAYRRGQFRRRRPGRMIATGPAESADTERAIVQAGRAALVDVAVLDRALRGLAHTAAERNGRMPDVIAARLGREELTLVLATSDDDPPHPWRAQERGTRWVLGRGDEPGYDAQRREYSLAPYPTLASVGYTDAGQQWLLDLERIGSLSLTGDPERCTNLARFLAAELAHNSWSEMLTVTMVGFGSELVAANPDRLSHTADLAGAIAHATTWLDTSGGDAVLAGRAGDAGDGWAPHVLLVDTSAADTQTGLGELREAVTGVPGRGCLAVVTADDPGGQVAARWQLHIDADGMLDIPALGVQLHVQQITVDEAAQLAQMLALAAEAEDTACPPAHGCQPWDEDTDAQGCLTLSARPRPNVERAELHLAEDDHPSDSLLPLPARTYLDSAAVVADDLDVLAPMVDAQIGQRVEADDPNLDTDLADWYDQGCQRPRITVLGKPTVRAAGQLPSRSPQLRANTEAAVYLATRGPAGVSSTVFAETMWPADPDVAGKSKVKTMISTLRGWLGRDPETGRDYLPDGRYEPSTAQYRIQGALIDAELFRRLRRRGMGRGSRGIADLSQALRLVTGPPFDGITERRTDDPGPGGWLWMTQANARLDLEYTGMIVDTAHTVATHHLAAGRPVDAATAVRAALAADSYDDVLLLDLIKACKAQGLNGEATAWEAQIRANYDGAELPPRTEEILRRLDEQDQDARHVKAG
jgi:nucleoid-associated protein YgaU/DNA-binding SARP family transcriptional activator